MIPNSSLFSNFLALIGAPRAGWVLPAALMFITLLRVTEIGASQTPEGFVQPKFCRHVFSKAPHILNLESFLKARDLRRRAAGYTPESAYRGPAALINFSEASRRILAPTKPLIHGTLLSLETEAFMRLIAEAQSRFGKSVTPLTFAEAVTSMNDLINPLVPSLQSEAIGPLRVSDELVLRRFSEEDFDSFILNVWISKTVVGESEILNQMPHKSPQFFKEVELPEALQFLIEEISKDSRMINRDLILLRDTAIETLEELLIGSRFVETRAYQIQTHPLNSEFKAFIFATRVGQSLIFFVFKI